VAGAAMSSDARLTRHVRALMHPVRSMNGRSADWSVPSLSLVVDTQAAPSDSTFTSGSSPTSTFISAFTSSFPASLSFLFLNLILFLLLLLPLILLLFFLLLLPFLLLFCFFF